MRVLEYSDLDTRKVKMKAALERDDFRSADVKKLAAGRHGRLYRARLDLADRLLFTFVRHQDEVCVLALEVILNHAYEKSRFLRGADIDEAKLPAFDTGLVMDAYGAVPAFVLSEQRRKRAFISAVLSRNEMNRDYAYNRRLFLRLRQGWYQFNPELAVRRHGEDGDTWTPIYQALNLPLLKEFTEPVNWRVIDLLLAKGGLPTPSDVPVAGKLLLAQHGRA